LDPKTIFVVAVTTCRMIFPGISPTVPLGDEPKNPVIPATKAVSLELYSSAKADGASRAQASVPAGLKVTDATDMVVDTAGIAPPATDASKTDSPKFTVKAYWGSSEAVPQGQPRVTTSDITSTGTSLPAGLPTTSFAYWPPDNTKPLASDVSAAGEYTLTTNYAGKGSVTLDKAQDFLPTIVIDNVRTKADLAKPFKFSWKPVEGALAYLVMATGGSGLETVTWSSSADPDALTDDITYRPVPKDELDKLLEKKVLLAPNATTCTVPAGIFTSSRTVLLTVLAVGADKVETKDGIESRVVVRSIVSMPVKGTSYQPGPLPPEEDENKKTDDKPAEK
jgi:hypothetical protein